MLDLLKFVLKRQPQEKRSHPSSKNSGFTLVELLVSTIVAFLIITPLLGFVMNILETERREQAKAATEQEIQAAIDYIGRDLAQAVYIYDGEGLKLTGIEPQLPYLNNRRNRVPVLVFWKRNYVRQVVPTDPNQANPAQYCSSNPDKCDDGYRYSLVAYYIVRETDKNSRWSQAARIERFELKDAARYFNGKAIDPNHNDTKGDEFFAPFVIEGNLIDSMNAWKTDPPGGLNTQGASNILRANTQVLVDYIDETPLNQTTLPDCKQFFGEDPNVSNTAKLVPQNELDQNAPSGFYGCVDASRTLAKVFLRGNASARSGTVLPYSRETSTYFPTTAIQVQGRSLLGSAE